MPNATITVTVASEARKILGAAMALAGEDRPIAELLRGTEESWESSIRGSGAAVDAMRRARAAYALAVAGDGLALDEIEAAADCLRSAIDGVASLRGACAIP